MNLITSAVANKYTFLRVFGSSLIVVLSFFFLLEDLEMLKSLFVNLNFDVLISCSEKSSVITTGFESYSELVSFSLEIPNEST